MLIYAATGGLLIAAFLPKCRALAALNLHNNAIGETVLAGMDLLYSRTVGVVSSSLWTYCTHALCILQMGGPYKGGVGVLRIGTVTAGRLECRRAPLKGQYQRGW
jgi:hypothetical protein